MARSEWLDLQKNLLGKIKMWKTFTWILAIFTTVTHIALVSTNMSLTKDINKRKVVLVPGLYQEIEVPMNSFVSKNFIKGVAKRVVELNEVWSYDSIEDNYDELFRLYYSDQAEKIVRTNLKTSNRIQQAKENEMVSFFEFDWSKSEYEYSEKIQKICAIISGTRKIYKNNNEPFRKDYISYFIVFQGLYPTHRHPLAMKVDRIKVDSDSSDPYQTMKKEYDAVFEGKNLSE